jgi:hypothetical protein
VLSSHAGPCVVTRNAGRTGGPGQGEDGLLSVLTCLALASSLSAARIRPEVRHSEDQVVSNEG